MDNRVNKVIVFTIEWRVEPEDLDLQGILDELRGAGWAEVIDIKVEDKKAD